MKFLIALGIVLIGFVVAATFYLQPNDFLGCQNAPIAGSECDSADAIVVVSGGNTPARTMAGVEMYKNGWAPVIIFSGAARDKTGPSNAAAMKSLALEQGVPSEAILVDEESETTQQNAQRVRAILESHEMDSIILVTSGYHQRRANLEFNKFVGENVTIRNHPVANDGDWGWWWWLTPRGWWLAGGEIVKIIGFYAGVSS